MFEEANKSVPLPMKRFYLNPHTFERQARGAKITNLPKKFKCFLVKQMRIGEKVIEGGVNKGIIPLPNSNSLMVCNLYMGRNTGMIYGKSLTILTEKQFIVSNNFNFGSYWSTYFDVHIKEGRDDPIVHADYYFDRHYNDFLRNKSFGNYVEGFNKITLDEFTKLEYYKNIEVPMIRDEILLSKYEFNGHPIVIRKL